MECGFSEEKFEEEECEEMEKICAINAEELEEKELLHPCMIEKTVIPSIIDGVK